ASHPGSDAVSSGSSVAEPGTRGGFPHDPTDVARGGGGGGPDAPMAVSPAGGVVSPAGGTSRRVLAVVVVTAAVLVVVGALVLVNQPFVRKSADRASRVAVPTSVATTTSSTRPASRSSTTVSTTVAQVDPTDPEASAAGPRAGEETAPTTVAPSERRGSS